MPEEPVAWKLSWVDYTGHVEGVCRVLTPGRKRPMPIARAATFATHAQAAEKLAELRAASGDGLAACISALFPPRAKSPPLLADLPVLRKRLTS